MSHFRVTNILLMYILKEKNSFMRTAYRPFPNAYGLVPCFDYCVANKSVGLPSIMLFE